MNTNYFYVQNLYNGSNSITIAKINNPSSGTDLSYSLDKNSWTQCSYNSSGICSVSLSSLNAKIYFRSSTGFSDYNGSYHIYGNKSYSIGGDIRTLIDYSNDNLSSIPEYSFDYFSRNVSNGAYSDSNNNLKSAAELDLSGFLILSVRCYRGMFQTCRSLTNAPSLPATTMAEACYDNMFAGCTSLSVAPSLSSIQTLAKNCCYYMFDTCSSLSILPTLPVTSLAEGCYAGMFVNCTSLIDVSALGQYNYNGLAKQCFWYMFQGCTSLTVVPQLNFTTMAENCYQAMFSGCTSLTTPPALPALNLAKQCYDQMFAGCTSLTTAPILPATSLAQHCYSGMFRGCTSLTTPPALPALNLANSCYSGMFNGCTSLTEAPSLPASVVPQGGYQNMFSGCTSLTTPPALPATTVLGSEYSGGYSGMFNGCISLTRAPQLPSLDVIGQAVYREMFRGCSLLNRIEYYGGSEWSEPLHLNWLQNVASTGDFYNLGGATNISRNASGVPSGWTIHTSL